MYLFVDTISDPTYIALFDEKREILDSQTWPGKQKEFDTLTEQIDSLIGDNNISYSHLSGIVVIIGPGSFTGTRVTTLIVNALNYGFNTPLFPLTVGEFFALQDAGLPWIMPVTKKEVLLWTEKKSEEYVLKLISDLPPGTYTSMASVDFTDGVHTLKKLPAKYATVIKKVSLTDRHNQVKPLYAKAPNITISTLHARTRN